MFDELLKIALKYHPSDPEKARREVLDYMAGMRKTLSENEKKSLPRNPGRLSVSGTARRKLLRGLWIFWLKRDPPRPTLLALWKAKTLPRSVMHMVVD